MFLNSVCKQRNLKGYIINTVKLSKLVLSQIIWNYVQKETSLQRLQTIIVQEKSLQLSCFLPIFVIFPFQIFYPLYNHSSSRYTKTSILSSHLLYFSKKNILSLVQIIFFVYIIFLIKSARDHSIDSFLKILFCCGLRFMTFCSRLHFN